MIFLSNLQAKRFADADAGRAKKNNVADDSMDVAKELMNTAKDLTISRVCVSKNCFSKSIFSGRVKDFELKSSKVPS